MKRAALKITAALIAALMCLAVLPFGAFAGTITPKENVSGVCGDDLEWTFESDSGVLHITGTGYMYDYGSGADTPWLDLRSSIRGLVIEYGAKSIGNYAFYNCNALTSAILPSSLESIGDLAFYLCSSLEGVQIPTGSVLTSIGRSAFNGCSKLKSAVIPDGVTVIYDSTFQGCSSLVRAVIGSGVTTIGNYAFYGCSSLFAILLPSSVTSIGAFAFAESGVNGVNLGSGLRTLGARAFYHCTSLEGVAVPQGVTAIAEGTFAGCSSLSVVELPASVTSIGMGAFSDCGSLREIVLPNSVAVIGRAAFQSCGALEDITFGSGTTEISTDAFSFCRSLTSVMIPEGVSVIGDGAFRVCSSLTAAVFEAAPPASFGEMVFEDCASGFAIVYNPAYASQWAPNGENTWNGYPIVSGESMSSGQLGGNLAWEFNPATGVLSITGAGAMAELSQFPWQGFANDVTDLVIGQGVTSIANNAFRGMSMLVNVSAADSVLTIGDSAFRDCTSIVEPRFPGVTTVGDYAFYDCTALEKTGCSSVVTMGKYAYCGCVSLSGFGVNALISMGEGAFKGCASIKAFRLPDGLTAVPDSAFENCTGLYFIGWGLDNRLESVGSRAFAGTGLTVVTFPESVTSIGAGAFADCPTLTTAVFNGNPPASVGSGAFAGAYPKFSVVYISDNASAWSSFGSAWNGYTLLSSTSLVSGVSDGGACWSVNYVTGVMTVYTDYYECGIGTRPGFSVPWDNYRTVPTDIVVGRGVISIGQYVFQNFTNATTVKLAEGIEGIGAGAFDGCKKLETAVIPETVTTLGYGVFKGCVKLTTAVIPDSVTECAGAVFEGCTSVTTAVVGGGMPWIPDALFKGCTSLASVTIPEGIAAINIVAFYNCTSLASVTIPSSVTALGDSVFQSCTKLETVVLPAGLTNLGSSAFRDCTKLTSVIFRGDPPATVGWDPFYGCTSALTLYYYASHAYAWAPNGETTWQGRPIVMLSGPSQGDVNGDGTLSANDALMVMRYALGLIDGIDASAADVNGDGQVTANDALLILRAALGLINL